MTSRQSSRQAAPVYVPGTNENRERGGAFMLQPASAQPNLLSPPANLSMLSIGSRGQFRENLSPSPNVHHAIPPHHARQPGGGREEAVESETTEPEEERLDSSETPLLDQAEAGETMTVGEECDDGVHHGDDEGGVGGARKVQKEGQRRTQYGLGALYGVVSYVCCVPTMVGYMSIIFSDPAFVNSKYMPYLMKLVFLSAVVHQLVFVFRSTLRFAVGQVQDAGLIFLSAMASDLVMRVDGPQARKHGVSEEAMATVLACSGVSTFLTGCLLVLTARLRLASLIQYLPMPVIAGNLAFIGLYCFEAAINLLTGGLRIDGISISVPEWLSLKKALILLSPGIVGAILMLSFQRVFQHWAVLPSLILGLPLAFYGALFFSGHTIADAQEYGFMDKPTGTIRFWEAFKLIRLDLVHWGQLPSQIPSLLGLYLVVVFGSTLDIAAIEMALGKKIDYNREIDTVGWGNVLSGLVAGGFTGSYLFGQNTLILKSGVHERITGAIVSLLEVCIFILPFNVMEFLPKLLFGAVLSFIGIDIMLDWLVYSYGKMHLTEYAVLWLSFGAIVLYGIEVGMAIGVVISALTFIVSYARKPATTVVIRPSNVIRSYSEREMLNRLRHRILELQCSGYLFFGSSQQINHLVESRIGQPHRVIRLAHDPNLAIHGAPSEPMAPTDADPSGSPQHTLLPYSTSGYVRFVILDLTNVNGVDATAARALTILSQSALHLGGTLIFAGMHPHVRRLLAAHGAVPLDSTGASRFALAFDSPEEARQWVENTLLTEEVPSSAVPLRRLGARRSGHSDEGGQGDIISILTDYLGPLDGAELARASRDLRRQASNFFYRLELTRGQEVFRRGDWPDGLYLVSSGEVTLQLGFSVSGDPTDEAGRFSSGDCSTSSLQSAEKLPRAREVKYANGGIFGDNDYALSMPRTFTAFVSSERATVYKLSASNFERMYAEFPSLHKAFVTALLKSMAMEALHFIWN